jgi:hypothetical protein
MNIVDRTDFVARVQQDTILWVLERSPERICHALKRLSDEALGELFNILSTEAEEEARQASFRLQKRAESEKPEASGRILTNGTFP